MSGRRRGLLQSLQFSGRQWLLSGLGFVDALYTLEVIGLTGFRVDPRPKALLGLRLSA